MCNSSWNEIKNGQGLSDRLDLIARIVKQKLMDFIFMVKFDAVCISLNGNSLPNAQILIWLKTKIHTFQIDDVIRTELQGPEEDRLLFNIVTNKV